MRLSNLSIERHEVILVYTQYWQEMFNLSLNVRNKPPEVLDILGKIPGGVERVPSTCCARNTRGEIKPLMAFLRAPWITRE